MEPLVHLIQEEGRGQQSPVSPSPETANYMNGVSGILSASEVAWQQAVPKMDKLHLTKAARCLHALPCSCCRCQFMPQRSLHQLENSVQLSRGGLSSSTTRSVALNSDVQEHKVSLAIHRPNGIKAMQGLTTQVNRRSMTDISSGSPRNSWLRTPCGCLSTRWIGERGACTQTCSS
jgi:hypothetical protein